jgi:hypothetical protein
MAQLAENGSVRDLSGKNEKIDTPKVVYRKYFAKDVDEASYPVYSMINIVIYWSVRR